MKKSLILAVLLGFVLLFSGCESGGRDVTVNFYLRNLTGEEVKIVDRHMGLSPNTDSTMVADSAYCQIGNTIYVALSGAWSVDVDNIKREVIISCNGKEYTITKDDEDGCLTRYAYRLPTTEEYFNEELWDNKYDEFYIYDLTIERLEAIKAKQETNK